MSSNPVLDACALEDPCAVPYEFVRLRYFFGQRLGVLELTDEQAYVVGKQRFHNQRLHGAGVLCGLRAERYVPSGAEATTLLRVSAGAAVDGCGREIVVGWDTCVDVAAFVRANRSTNPDLSDPSSPESRRLWVAVCYRECPSDPSPAVSGPCDCEPTGCENGRIREGFELKLLTYSQLPAAPFPPLPSEPCSRPPSDSCLVLARLELVVDDGGGVTDLRPPDNAPPERQDLWSTATLQAVLASALDLPEFDALTGPRFGPLTFAGTSEAQGTVQLAVALAQGADGTPSPLLGDPTFGVTFAIRRHDATGAWGDAIPTVSVKWDGAESRYDVDFGELAAARYRLTGAFPTDVPVVDEDLRMLRPTSIHRWITLEVVDGVLTLSSSLS